MYRASPEGASEESDPDERSDMGRGAPPCAIFKAERSGILLMAKRRRQGIVTIPFSHTVTLANPTNGTVVKGSIFTTDFTQSFYAISADCLWARRDAAVGQGPLQCGYALKVYTTAQIAEKINADEMNIREDEIAAEQGRRKVRTAGVFPVVETDEVLNNGQMIRTPLRFVIAIGGNLEAWIRNNSGVTLATGSFLVVSGLLYGRWI